jgi:hypothetical protein
VLPPEPALGVGGAWLTLCLLSTGCIIGAVAENCGDPLATCYVGNAKPGGVGGGRGEGAECTS